MKILMVCLGNICRSPLAEGILKSKLKSNSIFIDSAGTSSFHEGELPDQRSIAIAHKYNIDLTQQRSRAFKQKDFNDFDIIYVMDNSNKKNVLALAKTNKEKAKVKLILNESNPGMDLNVPDPYYGGEQGFENVYKMLDEACTIIAKKL